MTPLERALIEKAGHDHGFEYVLPGDEAGVLMASASHQAKVSALKSDGAYILSFTSPATELLCAELVRSFPALHRTGSGFVATSQDVLAQLLRRASALAHALPRQAVQDYDVKLKKELEQLAPGLKGTDVERLVRQRIGQQAFRSAMLDYWGGACAVTGVAIPQVLRASHAKPWADCDSDAERLDVFNGFLLTANLDALFDRFLITFTGQGELKMSERLPAEDRKSLRLDEGMRLRWLSNEHMQYLEYHRDRFVAK